MSWELLIQSSSHHNVTPALSWCLKDELVPPEVRNYLDAILCLNGKRNECILDGLAHILGRHDEWERAADLLMP